MSNTSKQFVSDSPEERRALLAQLLRTRSKQARLTYPLSQGQRALWFMHQLAPKSSAYNLSFAASIRSTVNIPALRGAFQNLIDRHAVLRTTFITVDGKPMQQIRERVEVYFKIIDAVDWSKDELDTALEGKAHTPFDLEHGPVLKVYLFTRSSSKHILLLTAHHIAVDALSIAILLDELREFYAARLMGREANVFPLPVQYTDYARWESQVLAGPEGQRHWEYWQKQLSGELPVLNITKDQVRPAVQTYTGAEHTFSINEEMAKKLRSLAKAEGVTLYMLLLAIFKTLLYRYTGEEDILIGSPMICRSRTEFERLVGYFINPVVLRTHPSANATFKEFLSQVRQTVLGAFTHKDYPFSLLVERIQPGRNPGISPFFQVLFNMPKVIGPKGQEFSLFAQGETAAQTRPTNDDTASSASHSGGLQREVQLDLGELQLDVFTLEQHAAMFDLSLSIVEVGQSLSATLQYNTDLFKPATIARLAGHYLTLCESVVSDSEQRLAELSLLTPEERQQLLIEWNKTDVEFSKEHQSATPTTLIQGAGKQRPYYFGAQAGRRESCFHHLFEAQVAYTPDAVAAVFKDKQLSYQELNSRANGLARQLVEQGVRPGVVVAVLTERNLDLLTTILAIFKAGGIYLPLDPGSPSKRLFQIVEQSKAELVLAASKFIETLTSEISENALRILEIEELVQHIQDTNTGRPQGSPLPYTRYEGGKQGEENLSVEITPDDIAYVIYTSGSTGLPKGAMIEHKGMLNHLFAKIKDLHLTEKDKVAETASQCFDISIWQFLAILLVGGSVSIFDDEITFNPIQLIEQVKLQQITILEIVPSLLQAVLAEIKRDGPSDLDRSLRWLILTGEALPPELCRQWLFYFPTVPMLNAYGPTECSDDVTHYALYQAPLADVVRIPIGRPIANTQLYILDSQFQPTPIGVAGELYVGGVGVGRGYLHDTKRTADVFLANPFAQVESRLYKTGDLAYYQADGNIQFLGRIDSQVKIRGFRIELGEIEATLGQSPVVQDAVVMAREDTTREKRLVAYVVPKQDAAPNIKDLRNFLKEKLPEYMIPSVFIFLDKLPLNANGKVDRRALPEPDIARPSLTESFVAPRNSNEEMLASIWREVLGLEQIGVHDNFFELGGDSIQGIQAISRANAAGLRFTPRQLFQYQTIAELAMVAGTEPLIEAEQGLISGEVPLTPIQHWFFEQAIPDPSYFSQSILLETQQPLNSTLLEQAAKELLLHHDVLRHRFVRKASTWVQESTSVSETITCLCVDLAALTEEEQNARIEAITTELQDSLNIMTGPVFRVALFNLGSDKPNHLLLVIHHLLVDRISCQILLEDLQKAYLQLSEGQTISLPAKTTSFKDWVERLTAHAQSTELHQESEYWLSLPWTDISSLPLDYPNGINTGTSADTVWTALNVEETQALLQELPAAYHAQINDILLTALRKPFARWIGSQALLLDLEGHGREGIFEDVDLSRTVGWFTSIFPVLLDLRNISQLNVALNSVKEHISSIPNRGIGYGILRYLTRDTELARKFRALPSADFSFNYLGRLDQALPDFTLFTLDSEFTRQVYSMKGNRRYLLNNNAGIVANKLHVAWTYSKSLHRRETIEALAQDYLQELRELIAYAN